MNKKITLQVINNEPTPIIKYVQCSTEVPIEFYIVDYKIPDSSEVRFYLMKPSGKEIYMPCQIKDNIITLNPTRQTFAEYGKQEGQLQVIQRDKQLLSFKLRFDIEENKIENGKIKSKDEFSILDELINEARVLLPETEKAKNNANTSADKANTAADKANKSASDANTATSKANQSAKLAEDKAKEIQQKADNGDFDGATFTPSVSPAGVISWTNDKGEENPASVNIKGPKGDKGDPGSIENISEQPITFTEATTEEPLESGDTVATLFGKAKKSFSSLEITEETQEAFKAIGWTPPTGGGEIASLFQFLLDRIHPIGSYYWSDDPTNPSELFGGEWEQIKDVFVLAAGDKYEVGNTGGETEHILEEAEMPAHAHTRGTMDIVGAVRPAIRSGGHPLMVDTAHGGCR